MSNSIYVIVINDKPIKAFKSKSLAKYYAFINHLDQKCIEKRSIIETDGL